MPNLPIDFAPEMVRALLVGRKTQTRRVRKKPDAPCRYSVGDYLWVREAVWHPTCLNCGTLRYCADTPAKPGYMYDKVSSSHMPRNLSRITLEVTEVRLQRVRDITSEDAKAEGVVPSRLYSEAMRANHRGDEYLCAFRALWDSLYTKPEDWWYENPQVWVISFQVVKEGNNDK